MVCKCLLSRPYPREDESLPSYLLRLISANHYRNPVVLLQHLGASISNNRLPAKKIWFGEFDTQAVERCANLTHGTLGLMAAKHIESNALEVCGKRFREHAIRYNRLKVCPFCLIENRPIDLSNSLCAKTLCLIHGVKLLTQSPETGRALTWGTHYLLNKVTTWDVALSNVPIIDCEWGMNQAIDDALTTGFCTPSASLGKLDLSTLLDLLYFFARFNTRRWLAQNASIRNSFRKDENYINAFNILENWPVSFHNELKSFEHHPLSKRGKSGLRHYYRDIYDALYAPSIVSDCVKQLIRPVFEQYLTNAYPYPIMSSAIRLGDGVLHNSNTVNEKQACNILKCPPTRLKLYVRVGLLHPIAQFPNDNSWYHRIDVDRLGLTLDNAVSLTGCAQALCISNHQTRKLLTAELLPALIKPTRENRDWLIEKSEIQQLVGSLKARSTVARDPDLHGFKRQTFRGMDIVASIKAILSGTLNCKMVADPSQPLSLHQFVPIPSLAEHEKDFVSPKEASELVGANINAIYDWMKRGFISYQKRKVERTARPVKLISKSSLAQFKRKFRVGTPISATNRQSYTQVSGPNIDGACVKLYSRRCAGKLQPPSSPTNLSNLR
ncbi:TniQ family protein [Alteromonas sp. S015]|uniref:TniQ family protein n=1 Tax=Alteromonas sp. S015 TaxID=3117401 RepID=UPI002FE218B1